MGYILDLREELRNKHRALIMTSAGVLIFNRDNKLLLQKRSDNQRWGLPGGSMELGETFEEVAIREVYEEVNLKVKKLSFFEIFSGKECHYIYPNGDEIYNASVIYICKDYTGELKFDSSETLDAKFFSKNEIPSLDEINPPDRVIIKKAKEKIEF